MIMAFNFKIPKTIQLHLRKDIKIPQKPTKELARLFGGLLGDGHLQLSHGVVSFYSKDINEIKKFESIIYKTFKTIGIIYKKKNKENDFSLFFSSKTLCEFLYYIGMPNGSKTDQEFLIPCWIMNGSNKIKGSFLSGFYDAEGSIYSTITPNNKTRWRIYIDQNKREDIKNNGVIFMNQIRNLLIDFNMNPQKVSVGVGNVRKNGIKTKRLGFGMERTSFKNFYRYVGFSNPHKQKKLIAALNNF